MTIARYAPLTIIAAFGVAFAAACGDEKTVADASAATTTVTPHRSGPLNLPGAAPAPVGGHSAVTLYRWRRELH
jgi:hypothetical protein